MATDLKVPSVGESISSVVVSQWMAEPGQQVAKDSIVVVLETDKINVEVPSPVSGTLTSVLKQVGDSAGIGDVLGQIEEGAGPAKPESVPEKPKAAPKKETAPRDPMPAAARVMEENKVNPADVKGTGKDGQILKEDAKRYVAEKAAPSPPAPTKTAIQQESAPSTPGAGSGRQEEVAVMGPLRQTIAKRLVEAQHTAALLTTFNEVDMSAVMELRSQFQTEFQAKHGGKLGFMSFFVKATVEALKAFPAVNAQIRDNTIVYHNYYDIGVAVGGGKGLVVPVLRNAERMSFSGVEKQIKEYAERAMAGKLKLEELQGGTFTISNGGVYGSMLSTPIVNPPQSGVLGLHKIMERPIALKGQVVIRPMMYLALTYDHRLVDGREAVSFLIRIKDCIENPTRILLEV
jgi:2-oxoglutarate dehydrogenase E2 component (dihydrolipoamide succinyltransferase)